MLSLGNLGVLFFELVLVEVKTRNYGFLVFSNHVEFVLDFLEGLLADKRFVFVTRRELLCVFVNLDRSMHVLLLFAIADVVVVSFRDGDVS